MREQLITKNTNFKKYFVQEDNLRSLQSEIVFSILRRYNCWAGCKICYVDELLSLIYKPYPICCRDGNDGIVVNVSFDCKYNQPLIQIKLLKLK